MRQAALTPVQIQIYIILYYIYQVGHVYLSVDWSVDIFWCGIKNAPGGSDPGADPKIYYIIFSRYDVYIYR